MNSKPPLKEFYHAAKAIYLPSILRSVKSRPEAEDMFHDLIEKIVQQWDTVEDPERYGWVILKNFKIIRGQKPLHNSIDTLIDFEFNLHLYSNETDSLITANMFEHAINNLDQIQKQMLQDFFISGIKYNPKNKQY